ncbi:integrase [Phyllobacterium sp. 1468]|uniref:integrase n=1 Tax=Phyllobacterium sp. 1468 TaxID=2817759 RepID=UPI0028551094|nr:site-specific integrase [Phyllobacterium sp. 1468]MDR6632301.1 integrase [Phyllobacterium sp. 1468]
MATIRRLRGRWQGQVRRKGMQPRAKSFDSKGEAEKWARSLEAELDRCGSMPDTRLAEQMTVHALLTRYRMEITPPKRSAQTESIRIGAMLRREICYRTLAILSPTDIAVYRDERLKVVASSTVLKELNVLGHAIDIARKEWGVHLPQNPCRMIRRPAPPRPRDRRLEAGEEQKLLDAADTGRNPYMRSLIILALETAMRQGELLSLSWADVDLERRIAHLDMTKNGESRDVPLSKRAIETLQRLADESTADLVLPISKSSAGQAWGHLRGRAGSRNLHFHDLRHEAVTRLLERGFNVIETATISGHKELRMLQRYSHLRAVDLVDRLG